MTNRYLRSSLKDGSEPRIVNGYCVARTFALERYEGLHRAGEGDYPDPESKRIHAVKVTNGASLATSHSTATTPCDLPVRNSS